MRPEGNGGGHRKTEEGEGLRRPEKDGRDRRILEEIEESVRRLERDGGGRRRTEEDEERRRRLEKHGGGQRTEKTAEIRKNLKKDGGGRRKRRTLDKDGGDRRSPEEAGEILRKSKRGRGVRRADETEGHYLEELLLEEVVEIRRRLEKGG